MKLTSFSLTCDIAPRIRLCGITEIQISHTVLFLPQIPTNSHEPVFPQHFTATLTDSTFHQVFCCYSEIHVYTCKNAQTGTSVDFPLWILMPVFVSRLKFAALRMENGQQNLSCVPISRDLVLLLQISTLWSTAVTMGWLLVSVTFRFSFFLWN